MCWVWWQEELEAAMVATRTAVAEEKAAPWEGAMWRVELALRGLRTRRAVGAVQEWKCSMDKERAETIREVAMKTQIQEEARHGMREKRGEAQAALSAAQGAATLKARGEVAAARKLMNERQMGAKLSVQPVATLTRAPSCQREPGTRTEMSEEKAEAAGEGQLNEATTQRAEAWGVEAEAWGAQAALQAAAKETAEANWTLLREKSSMRRAEQRFKVQQKEEKKAALQEAARQADEEVARRLRGSDDARPAPEEEAPQDEQGATQGATQGRKSTQGAMSMQAAAREKAVLEAVCNVQRAAQNAREKKEEENCLRRELRSPRSPTSPKFSPRSPKRQQSPRAAKPVTRGEAEGQARAGSTNAEHTPASEVGMREGTKQTVAQQRQVTPYSKCQ